MKAKKLYLGQALKGQKQVEILTSLRMDTFDRDEVKEIFNQFIDEAFDRYEEGEDDEFTDSD
jgi:hypothetical protein